MDHQFLVNWSPTLYLAQPIFLYGKLENIYLEVITAATYHFSHKIVSTKGFLIIDRTSIHEHQNLVNLGEAEINHDIYIYTFLSLQ